MCAPPSQTSPDTCMSGCCPDSISVHTDPQTTGPYIRLLSVIIMADSVTCVIPQNAQQLMFGHSVKVTHNLKFH